MTEEDKRYSRKLFSKPVVTKSGKKFGEVDDIVFDTRTGELLQLVLKNPTPFTRSLELEHDEKGRMLVPYHSIVAIGDFVVVAEEDII